MSRIGLASVHYAKITSDPAGGTPVYGAVTAIPGAAVANVNPNSSTATDFLDDGPADVAVTLGASEVTFEFGELTAAIKADLLGNDYTGGVLTKGGDDVPPFVALGFKTLKSNGEYRYKWIHKVKFREPEDNAETKGESIAFQHDTLIGAFVKRDSDGKWQAEADADDDNVVPATIAAWFDSVPGTSPDTTPPTFTSVPADAATAVAVDAAITITFDEAMDTATLVEDNFIISDVSDGTIVPFTIATGSTSATLTPASNLDSATEYQVNIATAVTDAAGNALAAAGSFRFTTA